MGSDVSGEPTGPDVSEELTAPILSGKKIYSEDGTLLNHILEERTINTHRPETRESYSLGSS